MKTTGLVFEAEHSTDTEPSGTVLADLSRFGNDGAMKADGEPNYVQLRSGLWVLDFDGSDDYIEVPYHNSLDITDAITLMAWVKTSDDTLGAQAILNKTVTWGTETNYGLRFHQSTGNKLRFAFFNGSFLSFFSTSNVPQDIWAFVVVTYNRVNVQVYIDGLADGAPQAQAAAMIGDGSSELNIGTTTAPGYTDDFLGQMALHRVHTRALSAAEVYERYQFTRGLFGV